MIIKWDSDFKRIIRKKNISNAVKNVAFINNQDNLIQNRKLALNTG